jgi:MoaE-MoaD fusion protein
MQVRVRLFAGLRERAGAAEVELELPDGALVRDALERMRSLTDGVPVVLAVNQEYADAGAVLHPGDEVALIPPVSGGSSRAVDARVSGASSRAVDARVTSEPLSLDELIRSVREPRAGAIVTFQGVTRDVAELDYEAYVVMAERKIGEIVAAAIERHRLCAAAAAHRVGIVPLSEASVAVAASAPHREEAFAGAREIIDRIKAEVPIWKKEEGEWVAGTTPEPGS